MAEPFQANPYARDPFQGDFFRTQGESLTLPVINYVLLLLAVPTGGLSLLAALVMAYASKDGAGNAAWSHYVFQIRTFWWSLAAITAGIVVMVVSIPLMFVLIGFPLFVVGLGLMLGGKIWYLVRCVVGLIHAANGRSYPDPRAMIL